VRFPAADEALDPLADPLFAALPRAPESAAVRETVGALLEMELDRRPALYDRAAAELRSLPDPAATAWAIGTEMEVFRARSLVLLLCHDPGDPSPAVLYEAGRGFWDGAVRATLSTAALDGLDARELPAPLAAHRLLAESALRALLAAGEDDEALATLERLPAAIRSRTSSRWCSIPRTPTGTTRRRR